MRPIIFILPLSILLGALFILLSFFLETSFSNGFIVVGLCILLGLAVKMMDILIDEIKVKSYKIWIIPLGIFIPVSMAYLALTEEPVIGMVIGAAIGLLLAAKLDHIMYKVSVVLFVILIIIGYTFKIINVETTTFYIIPIAAIGSFLDEFGHERWKSNKKIIMFILNHRFFLKSCAALGFILGYANLFHLIGFLCFDIFYDITDSVFQDKNTKKRMT